MKKQIVTVGLTLALIGTSTGWALAHNENNELIKTVTNKQAMIEKQSNQIANLENVIVKKDEDINIAHKTIQQKDQTIQGQNEEIKKLKEEIENFKKKQEGSDVEGRKITVEATAYISMCSEGCTGRTATGVDVSNTIYYQGYRVIATDPNVIPLNSLVKVETRNETFTAMAIDKGGGIHGNEIDLLVSSESNARQFGRQQATITILQKGE